MERFNINTRTRIAWTQSMTTFNNIYNQCTTINTITIKEHKKLKPCITNAIIESIKDRDNLKKIVNKNNQNFELLVCYKNYRNKLIIQSI